MERIRSLLFRSACLLTVGLAAVGFAVSAARAQGGMATVHVVDQNGNELNGSVIRLFATDITFESPAQIPMDPGPAAFTIEPAVQGAMFPGGWARPAAANGLSRDEFAFFDGSSDIVIEWRTATVAVGVTDQNGAAIPGASWGFAGEGAWFAPGTITLPVTDENLYPFLTGASANGWNFAVRAAFDGQAVDLTRDESREIDESTPSLSFEWRQLACTMGVVDGSEAPIRGATWTVLGHTFAAGDAIALPATDGSVGGALADGFPMSLFTNTPAGTGAGTFEVGSNGVLSPAFISIGGESFGLRCGVSPFPPITVGSIDGTVLADGAPMSGASVSVLDANGATHALTTGAGGAFSVADVPQGPATVTLAIPTGFHGVDPPNGVRAVTVVAEGNVTANFTIAADPIEPPPPPPPPLANNPETWNYWRKEVKAALTGKGPHMESFKDMAENFPQAIFAGFANDPDPVRVEGVTQVDPDGPSGAKAPRRLDLNDMTATLDPGSPNSVASAKRELLVVLLNVVSGRLSLELVVDANGTTLAQEIRVLAAMINDGQASNDRTATNRGARINAGHAMATLTQNALRMSGTPGVAYGDTRLETQNLSDGATGTANQLSLTAMVEGASSVRITLTTLVPTHAWIDLYDVAGRRVSRLYEGDAPVGATAVTWQRGSAGRGVYFAQVVTQDGTRRGAKIVVTQ